MLKIKTFQVNMIAENCYILSDDTQECVIIDCGAYYSTEHQAIQQYIEDNHLTPKHLLNTHGHFDHVIGNQAIYIKYNLGAELHAADADIYSSLARQTKEIIDTSFNAPTPPIAHYLAEGDTISFGNHTLHVIETPGHTPGGICFYDKEESILFSGDSLFQMSIGRTDFPGGSLQDLLKSLKEKILTLPDTTIVYPGHGPTTTIAIEKTENPYLQ